VNAPILYSFRRCPYAMRARMALLVSGLAVEIREVVLRNKPPAMLAASPKGTVPVLVAGGAVIDESLDIMRYALARNDPEGWLTGDDAVLIAANDGPFKHHLDRYKYPERHGSEPKEHRAAALLGLEPLETRLARTPHLHGATRTLADIALFPFVRQFAAVEPDWFAEQALPRLKHWLAAHIGSDLFERAMVRRPAWREGDPPVLLA
jgi:glutathione S-transferase